MKSLQCIYKKQAINFAPLQSAEGHKCSSKGNEELNQGNKILLVPTWALNLNQVTVGNGPVVCPCTTTSATIKRTSHNLWASHAASLGQGRKSLWNFFPFALLGEKVLCSAILILHLMYLCLDGSYCWSCNHRTPGCASASNKKAQQKIRLLDTT